MYVLVGLRQPLLGFIHPSIHLTTRPFFYLHTHHVCVRARARVCCVCAHAYITRGSQLIRK